MEADGVQLASAPEGNLEAPFLTGVPEEWVYEDLSSDDLVERGFAAGIAWQTSRDTHTAEDASKARIGELVAEMDDWVTGRRSRWNTFCSGSPERRTEQMAHCAIADAQEVVRLSAAIQAYAALRSAGL